MSANTCSVVNNSPIIRFFIQTWTQDTYEESCSDDFSIDSMSESSLRQNLIKASQCMCVTTYLAYCHVYKWQPNSIKAGLNSLKCVEKAFWKVLLKFCSLEMSMVVETHRDPRMELYHNTPRGYRG